MLDIYLTSTDYNSYRYIAETILQVLNPKTTKNSQNDHLNMFVRYFVYIKQCIFGESNDSS